MGKRSYCPYTGKAKFDKLSARRQSRWFRKHDGSHMAAYWCGCGAWHVGHMNRTYQERRVQEKKRNE